MTRLGRRWAPPPPAIDAVGLMQQAAMTPDPWQCDLLNARPARALVNSRTPDGQEHGRLGDEHP